MKNISIMAYILSVVSIVMGLLGVAGYMNTDPWMALFMFLLLREISEFTMGMFLQNMED